MASDSPEESFVAKLMLLKAHEGSLKSNYKWPVIVRRMILAWFILPGSSKDETGWWRMGVKPRP